MIDPLETPEGQRIVWAMAQRAADHGLIDRDEGHGGILSYAYSAIEDILRAALSVTGECKTCGGKRELRDTSAPLTGLKLPCVACNGSGRAEPLLVLREQS